VEANHTAKVRVKNLVITMMTNHGNIVLYGFQALVVKSSERLVTMGRPVTDALGVSSKCTIDRAMLGIGRDWEYYLPTDLYDDDEIRPVRNNRAVMETNDEGEVHAMMEEEIGLDIPDQYVKSDRAKARDEDNKKVRKHLKKGLDKAVENGLKNKDRMGKMLERYVDVFRETLQDDPPVDYPLHKVLLKPGSEPYAAKPRGYAADEAKFLEEFTDYAIDVGLLREADRRGG
jgi:hypothetical protein